MTLAATLPAPVARVESPVVYVGDGALESLLLCLSRPLVVLLDARARVGPALSWLVGRLPGEAVRSLGAEADIETVHGLAGWLRERPGHAVLAVGGGNVVDAAKLAALDADRPGLLDGVVRDARRAGLVRLAADQVRDRRLYAVPTTLGTGVEASSVACARLASGRVLVMGAGLGVDAAALDPAATQGLPAHLVREGVAEAFLRLLGPYVTNRPNAIADAEALFLLHRLAALLELDDAALLTPAHRLAAAAWSGATHRGMALTGRAPLGSPLWFLANELSFAAGSRKVPASSALVLPWLERVRAGDERWGHRDRLLETPLAVPGVWRGWGVTALTEAQRRVDVEALARTTGRRWGGRLPMLGRFGHDELRAVFAAAVSGPGPLR